MKKKLVISGIPAALLVLGLVFVGCKNPANGNSNPATTFVPVTSITNVTNTGVYGTDISLSGTVTPTNATNKTITWSVKSAGTTGATVNGNKLKTTAAGTVVVLASIANGKTATTPYTQDVTITISAPAPAPVTSFDLTGTVTVPAKGNSPDTRSIDTPQYTGTIAWQDNSGAAVTSNFAATTVYKAVVTLTAKTGFTFNGVAANRFIFTGATTVTNAVNSGVVTITFPATGS